MGSARTPENPRATSAEPFSISADKISVIQTVRLRTRSAINSLHLIGSNHRSEGFSSRSVAKSSQQSNQSGLKSFIFRLFVQKSSTQVENPTFKIEKTNYLLTCKAAFQHLKAFCYQDYRIMKKRFHRFPETEQMREREGKRRCLQTACLLQVTFVPRYQKELFKKMK